MKGLFKYFFLSVLLPVMFNGYAQNRQIDSLKNILKSAKEDSNKVNILNNLCIQFISTDLNDSAFKYALTAKSISQNINFKRGLAVSLNVIANVYFYQSNYSEALKNNLAALKLREELGDKKGIANCYNNIGNVYFRLNNATESLKNHFAALNIRQQTNDTANIGFSYNNIGNVYQKEKNYKEALKYHFESLKIKQALKNEEEIFTSLNNIGIVYTEMGNYTEALNYQFEALKMAEKNKDQEGIEIIYVNLCNTYFKLQNYSTAEEYGLKALVIATKIGDTETVLEANLHLSEIFKKSGKFEKALYHYTTYINFRDSLFNEESIKKTVQTQLQSEFERTIASTKLEQDKKEAVAKVETKKQRIVLTLVSCVLILVLSFALFTYRNFKQKQKAHKIIIRQKHEVEEQKNTIEEKNKDITGSITYAKRIQEAILPSIESIKEKLPDSFVMYLPKDIVAGDFYWVSDAVTNYQEKFIMVSVADCTGHGVPGALMSIIGNNYLRICEREPTVNRPSEALDFINAGISRTFRQEYSKSSIQDGMDMAFVAIDYNTNLLHFAGAKNPIYIIRSGILTEYKGDRHPIGAFIGDEMKKFTNKTIPIQKGDCVYLFSDGYADQFGGPNGKKFMYSRFKDLLTSNSHLPMETQHEMLIKTFNEWKGNLEQVDDVCIIGIRL